MARNLNELLIVDLEATCTKEKDPNFIQEIIEIGIVRLNLKTLEIKDAEGIIVIPQKSYITPFCTELTTITQEMIDKEGRTYLDAFNYINDKYKPQDKGWASWGDFDRNQMAKNDKLYNNPNPLFGRTHTNLKHQFSVLNGFNREYGMEKALEICNIPLEGTHHRAVWDAKNIAKIYKHCLIKFRIKD